MTALVLDAGAFIAVERQDREMLSTLAAALREEVQLRTSAIVLGQVWRSGTGRRAALARLLPAIDVVPVDTAMGQATEVLTGRARTSDPIDIGRLVTAAGFGVDVIAC